MLRSVETRTIFNVFDLFVSEQRRMDAAWLRRKVRDTSNAGIKAWNSARLQSKNHNSIHEDNEELIVTNRILGNDLPTISEIQTLPEQYQESQNRNLLSQEYQNKSQEINCFTQCELASGNQCCDLNVENFQQTFTEPLNEHDCRDQFELQPPMQAYCSQINPLMAKEQLQTSFSDGKLVIDQRYGNNNSNTGQIYSNHIIPSDTQLSGMKYLEIQNSQEISSQSTWQGCVANDTGLVSQDCNLMYCTDIMPTECENYGYQSRCEAFPEAWLSYSSLLERNSPENLAPSFSPAPLNSKSNLENSMWSSYRVPSSAVEEYLEPIPSLPRTQNQSWSEKTRRLLPSFRATSIHHNIAPAEGLDYTQVPDLSLFRMSHTCNADNMHFPQPVSSTSDKQVTFHKAEKSPRTSSPPEVNSICEEVHSKGLKSYATTRRNARDEFLIQKKQAGMSYKDIKREGGYTEAESTLRGRFRTLTKAKSARVRKPEWSDNDNRLLKQAVNRLAPKGNRSKIPWKKVAEFIVENGGSYHFGNSTCRKRWDELNGTPKVAAVSKE
ncbi:hypothetical protein K3495_g5205 [Podosphaera aphanis]|nr:hypothetical protein K3495_g5205 [Podosphaera aphanis]